MAVFVGDDANDTLFGGSAADDLQGLGGNDSLNGGSGNDSLAGGTGNDTLTGSGGQDSFVFAEFGAANADTLTDFAGNWDSIRLDGAAFAGLGSLGRFSAGDVRFFAGTAAHDADDRIIYNSATGQLWYDADGNGSGAAQLIATLSNHASLSAADIWVFSSGTPPPADQTINGTAGNDSLVGGSGNDTINGNAGNDTLIGNGGNDSLDGGSGADSMDGGLGDDIYVATAADILTDSGGIDTIQMNELSWTLAAGFENVVLGVTTAPTTTIGNSSNNSMIGNAAANTLNGMAGNDTLTGGAGADSFIFNQAAGAANADTITDFASGVDKVRLDGSVMNALGASGNFAAGDVRFFAGTTAHDADDRVIWDGSSLWYDADGSGAGAAQLIARVTGSVVATDIAIDNGSSGQAINGTAGNDTLVGGAGNDSISGLAGNDSLVGNAGNDTLVAGPGNDTLDGGAGDDVYVVDGPDAWAMDRILVDPGGVDVVLTEDAWSLDETGIENLSFVGTSEPLNHFLIGNSLDNVITDGDFGMELQGLGGNDTLIGNGGDDWFSFFANAGESFGQDSVSGGAGFDQFYFWGVSSAITVDLAAGTLTGSAGSITFSSIEGVTGTDAADRIDAGGMTAAVSLFGRTGDDTLLGGAGADTMSGWEGNDSISGGAGNDSIVGEQGNDTILGGDGNDTVDGGIGANLVQAGAGDDFIGSGWELGGTNVETLDGGAGSDTLGGSGYSFVDLGAQTASNPTQWGGNSATLISIEHFVGDWRGYTVIGSAAANLIAGGVADDSLDGAGGNDTVTGGDGNDTVAGGAGNDSVTGGAGDDWLRGDAGVDTLIGGTGQDRFAFAEAPASANADQVTDFTSGTDQLVFDTAGFAAIGEMGNFLAGDARFHAAAGANAAHDADDRVIYNTTTGQLYYDADGSGSGAAVLLATLQGAPTVVATDIVVMTNGVTGQHLTGTAGADSLVGGRGNDTIEGLQGNDTLIGNQNYDWLDGGDGSDSMLGGDGNDTLTGGYRFAGDPSRDTMDGGEGNDTYIIGRQIYPGNADTDLVLRDSGGIDTIVAEGGWWVLADGFENLELGFDWSDEGWAFGTGNAADNVITGFQGWWVNNFLDGGDGSDTLIGGDGSDYFQYESGSHTLGADSIDGGGDVDWLDFTALSTGATVDFRDGTISGGGHFANIEAVAGSGFDDLLIGGDVPLHDEFGDPIGVHLNGWTGNDTLIGGANNDWLLGDAALGYFFNGTSDGFGDDSLRGGGGNDNLDGGRGADWLDGGTGTDYLRGGLGADTYAFTSAAGSANSDWLYDFETGVDLLRFDTAVYSALGAQGRFAAGDARFFSGTAAHDADDRLIYDSATGNLWYDADGTGAGAAQLVATVQGTSLAATDIVVGLNDTAAGQSFTGTAGNDSLTGTAGNDSLTGLAGNDTLNGGAGRDTMDGGSGNDTYIVDSLSDVLVDSGGVDTVIAQPNVDDYALKGGFENLVLQSAAAGEAVGNDLNNRLDASASAGRVVFDGKAGNDTLIGTNADPDPDFIDSGDYIQAWTGDDVVFANGGNDYVEGWLGSDSIIGGDGHDRLYGGRNFYLLEGDGNDTIEGGAGNDNIEGGEGNDLLRGGSGNDFVWGDLGADTVYGGEGDDALGLSEFGFDLSHDLLDGGAGNDSLYMGDMSSFFGTGLSVNIDLAAGTVTSRYSWWQPTATLIDIENATAGGGDDLLLGSAGANYLSGGEGYDTIDGGEGNDTLYGEGGIGYAGHNTFVMSAAPGAANADTVYFASNSDTLRLDARAMSSLGAAGRFSTGDDRFYAAAGANAGHDADDRIVFDTTTGDVWYDADGSGAGAAQLVATIKPLSFSSQFPQLAASDIEVVNGGAPAVGETTGTAGNDSLTGGSGRDAIDGGAGNDTVSGAGGDDALGGGAGNDVLTGGAGADVFVLDQPAGAANADAIADFTNGLDRLQLDGSVLGNLGAPGPFWDTSDVRFYAAAGANAAHDADDRLVYNTTTGQLWYDADGNGAGTAQLLATLQGAPVLAATDISVLGTPAGKETPDEILQPPLSGDLHIDALLGNFIAWDEVSNSDGVIQYTFSIGEGLGPLAATAFNANLQDATRQAIAQVAAITGVQFEEVSDGNVAELHFANSWLEPYGAAGLFTTFDNMQIGADGQVTSYDPDGYVYLDNFTDATPGTLNYQILLHELGHAMGLKHPHDYPVELMPGEDDNVHTVMTYYQTVAPQDEYAPYDVAALQWLYGGDGLGGAGARASGVPPQWGTFTADRLLGGGGHDLLFGDAGNDTLVGGAGNDWLIGWDGADFMDGGAGDDRFAVDSSDDMLADSGGIDSVFAEISWTLGAGFENLRLQFVYDDPRDWSATGNTLSNILSGNAGNNVISGLEGDDSMYGWFGNDVFAMSFASGGYGSDLIDGGGDFDTVDFSSNGSAVTVDLAAGTATGGGGSAQLVDVEAAIGTAFADRLIGSDAVNVLEGGAGHDTLTGGAGPDTFDFATTAAAANADVVTDFASVDTLRFDASVYTYLGIDDFVAGDGRFWVGTAAHDLDDRLVYNSATGDLWYDYDGTGTGAAQLVATLQGAPTLDATQIDVLNGRAEPDEANVGTSGNDSLTGKTGDDYLAGQAGNDTLTGLDGEDTFAFEHAPGAANADTVTDFHGGLDKLLLRTVPMPALGALGNFADNDARFYAAAGANSGHDADDRLVYNATTGQLWYDADGSGTGAAQLVFTLQGAPTLTASDIIVAEGGMLPSGVTVNGTAGNDSLVGGTGNDTLNGFAGNDTLDGAAGVDSMEGGAGNDLYFVDDPGDIAIDIENGGIDEVRSSAASYVLGDWVNDLTLVGNASAGTGNAIDNRITGNAGNDTLAGGGGADSFIFNQAAGAANADSITDFASGVDKIRLDGSVMTAIGPSGNFVAGDARFFAGTAAHDADDRVIWDGASLWYDADGNGAGARQKIADVTGTVAATDIAVDNGGTAPPTGGQTIAGTSGNDSLTGGAGNDSINGGSGNDSLWGAAGNDTLTGSGGQDTFVFREFGAGDADRMTDFATNWDRIQVDDAAFTAAGATGRLASGDARFFAGTAAHDADDRFVFNAGTGQLYYDADGNGSGGAQLVATVQAGATVAATDITVI